MDWEIKTFKFEVKEVDEEEGTFTGYAATFSKHPDSYGDIIDPGAFKKTIKEMGKRIKVLWSHNIFEPIGKPTEISEDDTGLLFKAKLSLGVQRARETLSLMKDGVITEMSIGYNPVKEKVIEGIRHLTEIKLYDISPVTFAANPEAIVLGVKAAEGKPLPNEHACRLRNPDDFEDGSFRRMNRVSDGKKYAVIMGRLEGETTLTEQAYRYHKEVWEEAEAKTHCGEHDGSFEAAEKQVSLSELLAGLQIEHGADKSGRVLSASSMAKVRAAVDALNALLEAAENEPEPDKSTQLTEVAEEAARLEAMVAELKAKNDGFDVREAERRIEAILEKLETR